MADIHVDRRDRLDPAWDEVNMLYREAIPVLPRTGQKKRRPCPFCGASSSTFIRSQYEFALEQCTSCRGVFVNDLYTPDVQQAIDNEFTRLNRVRNGYLCIHPEAGMIGDFEKKIRTEVLLEETRFIISILKEIGWKDGRGKTFLDVGCFKGYSVLAASRFGLEATGIEFDPKRTQFARDVLKVKIISTLFEDLIAEGKHYDMITARHILEHIYHPLDFLKKAHDLLVPGGKLILLLPNFYCVPIQRMYDDGMIWGDFTIHHINYYSLPQAVDVAKQAGFRVNVSGSAGTTYRGKLWGSIQRRYGIGPGFLDWYLPAGRSWDLRHRVKRWLKQRLIGKHQRRELEELFRDGVSSTRVTCLSQIYNEQDRGSEICILASK